MTSCGRAATPCPQRSSANVLWVARSPLQGERNFARPRAPSSQFGTYPTHDDAQCATPDSPRRSISHAKPIVDVAIALQWSEEVVRIFWPSFNRVIASALVERHRPLVNPQRLDGLLWPPLCYVKHSAVRAALPSALPLNFTIEGLSRATASTTAHEQWHALIWNTIGSSSQVIPTDNEVALG